MDHRAKLNWAREHFDALEKAVDAFIESKPYVMSAKFDAKQMAYEAFLKECRDTPPEWSLMIGDIVHNMRSALDALTYSLACKNLGRPPTDDEVIQIQFVIVDEVKHWPGECGRRLRHLHAGAVAEIERLQPYHRTDFTRRHHLSALRDLSNVDKHRYIHVTLAAATASGITIKIPDMEPLAVTGHSGPIKQGTVIGRWVFRSEGGIVFPPLLLDKMDVRGQLGLDIHFANAWPAWGGSVMGFLPVLHDHIRDVVFPPLEAFL